VTSRLIFRAQDFQLGEHVRSALSLLEIPPHRRRLPGRGDDPLSIASSSAKGIVLSGPGRRLRTVAGGSAAGAERFAKGGRSPPPCRCSACPSPTNSFCARVCWKAAIVVSRRPSESAAEASSQGQDSPTRLTIRWPRFEAKQVNPRSHDAADARFSTATSARPTPTSAISASSATAALHSNRPHRARRRHARRRSFFHRAKLGSSGGRGQLFQPLRRLLLRRRASSPPATSPSLVRFIAERRSPSRLAAVVDPTLGSMAGMGTAGRHRLASASARPLSTIRDKQPCGRMGDCRGLISRTIRHCRA